MQEKSAEFTLGGSDCRKNKAKMHDEAEYYSAKWTKQVPEYTKQKGLDKKKLLTMLQQVVENAGEAGIKLNDIYEYMEVTLPVGKSMAEKKRQLRYLLNLLKDDGIVSRERMRWIFVMDTQ